MGSRDDIIYTAGYTDGDGCFHLSYLNKKFRAVFIINSVNPRIIEHLTERYFGTMRGYSRPSKNWKGVYDFRLHGSKAIDFAKQLLPHLIQKKKECAIFTAFDNKSSKISKLESIKLLKYLHSEGDLISYSDIEKLKAVKNVEPVEEDFIYMAGFIDAECCFGIQKYKPSQNPNYVYKILLQLNDTKAPMFYWIKSRFGGFCNFSKRIPPLKSQITWRLVGKSLYPFLKKVCPYLRYKKPVCEKLIEFYETTLPNGGARHTEVFRKSYASVIEKRESIIQQVHDLNKKGL